MVELPDTTPVTTYALRIVAGRGTSARVQDITPVSVIRVGPLVTFTTAPAEFAIEASVAQVVFQATSGGRAFVNQGAHTDVHRIQSYEGQNVSVKARPVAPDGTGSLLRKDVTEAAVLIFDDALADKSTPIHQLGLVVADVMETALVNDAGWKADSPGYSFSYVVPGVLLREGGHVYRCEFILKTSVHGPVAFVQEVETIGLRSPRSYIS